MARAGFISIHCTSVSHFCHGHTIVSQMRQQSEMRVPIQSMKKSANVTKGGVYILDKRGVLRSEIPKHYEGT